MGNKEFAEQLIDTILNSTDELNVIWNYGEECVRVCDVIKLIREEAKICIDDKCWVCQNHYSRYEKSDHRRHCMGRENICENYKCVLDD